MAQWGMQWKYDADVDAAYLAFVQIPAGGVSRSVEVHADIVLDFGPEGHLLGIEVLNASKRLQTTLVAVRLLP